MNRILDDKIIFTKVVSFPLDPVPLMLVLLLTEFEVIQLFVVGVAGAEVVPLVGQLAHLLHQLAVHGKNESGNIDKISGSGNTFSQRD